MDVWPERAEGSVVVELVEGVMVVAGLKGPDNALIAG